MTGATGAPLPTPHLHFHSTGDMTDSLNILHTELGCEDALRLLEPVTIAYQKRRGKWVALHVMEAHAHRRLVCHDTRHAK